MLYYNQLKSIKKNLRACKRTLNITEMRINVISEQHAQLLKEAKKGPYSEKVLAMAKLLKKHRAEKVAEEAAETKVEEGKTIDAIKRTGSALKSAWKNDRDSNTTDDAVIAGTLGGAATGSPTIGLAVAGAGMGRHLTQTLKGAKKRLAKPKAENCSVEIPQGVRINLISEESYEEGENALDAKINAAGKKKGAFKNSRIPNHPTPSNQPPQKPRIPNHPAEPLNFTVGTAFPPEAESNRVQRRVQQKIASKGHQRKSETLATPEMAEKLRKLSSKAKQNCSVEIPMGIKINLIEGSASKKKTAKRIADREDFEYNRLFNTSINDLKKKRSAAREEPKKKGVKPRKITRGEISNTGDVSTNTAERLKRIKSGLPIEPENKPGNVASVTAQDIQNITGVQVNPGKSKK